MSFFCVFSSVSREKKKKLFVYRNVTLAWAIYTVSNVLYTPTVFVFRQIYTNNCSKYQTPLFGFQTN